MKRLLLILLLSLSTLAQAGPEIAGVRFADQVLLGGRTLPLNGAGLRSKLFFKVYAIALYMPARQTEAAGALQQPGPKRIELVVLRQLDAQQLVDALISAFNDNHDAATQAAFKPRLTELQANMLQAGQAKPGDVIKLDWLPEQGLVITLDAKPLGQPIAGEDFYRALMKIWLGDKPAQDNLKAALLGKPQ